MLPKSTWKLSGKTDDVTDARGMGNVATLTLASPRFWRCLVRLDQTRMLPQDYMIVIISHVQVSFTIKLFFFNGTQGVKGFVSMHSSQHVSLTRHNARNIAHVTVPCRDSYPQPPAGRQRQSVCPLWVCTELFRLHPSHRDRKREANSFNPFPSWYPWRIDSRRITKHLNCI